MSEQPPKTPKKPSNTRREREKRKAEELSAWILSTMLSVIGGYALVFEPHEAERYGLWVKIPIFMFYLNALIFTWIVASEVRSNPILYSVHHIVKVLLLLPIVVWVLAVGGLLLVILLLGLAWLCGITGEI